MVTKKDILELKRRYTKENCTITKMRGCYVDGDKQKIVELNETFLNLEEEEFFKYLEIVKKSLSGTIGNNILELEIPLAEEQPGGKQQYFMALKESGLKDDNLVHVLYDAIIDNYNYVGNYLILLFHDRYDVITKTNDNMKLDESEEVYEYFLCSICPVTLSKAGLGYRQDENRIGARVRDWVVGAPNTAFLFPSFADRSSDIHAFTYYVKDAKDSQPEFVEGVLGCDAKRTATEEKEAFHGIVKGALAPVTDQSDELLLEIQETISSRIEQEEDTASSDEVATLTKQVITEVLSESGVPEEAAKVIEDVFVDEFGENPPPMAHLIDNKAIEANAKAKREKELVKEVMELRQEIVEKALTVPTDEENEQEDSSNMPKTYDVVVRIKPEKATQIKSQVIEGKKCLVIPVEDEGYVNINGVNTKV